MKWTLCPFDELSAEALYEILALRAEVFVVEQECAYLDPDGKDLKAYHLLGQAGCGGSNDASCNGHGELAAYARIFAPGDYLGECSIGRVAVSPRHRGAGLGRELMERSLAAIERLWGDAPVTISAQQYLEKFYASLGFVTLGEPYLEDGIPHIRMRKIPQPAKG